MPALGVAQEKGTLINWRKAEGQTVTKGEPLMEIETDKATVEIEAPASGILTNVIAFPGDEIPVGNRIAIIRAPGERPHPDPLPEGEGTKNLPQKAVEKEGNVDRQSGPQGWSQKHPQRCGSSLVWGEGRRATRPRWGLPSGRNFATVCGY
jgi:pyruvate dehydrogenase E2 component (dihydrolipoamide acetyltransferase)